MSRFGISRERRAALERLIGGVLDQAKLDDLLVCGGGNGGGVYDVNFALRLVRLFVHEYDKISIEKMMKVGQLIDMYLGEIGPDPTLKIAKFLGVAESLPDFARDSFDQVYRAIDVFLQVHFLHHQSSLFIYFYISFLMFVECSSLNCVGIMHLWCGMVGGKNKCMKLI